MKILKRLTSFIISFILAFVLVCPYIKAKELVSTMEQTNIDINELNFKDKVFMEYVKTFDTDNNNKLSEDEISKVTTISLNNSENLRDLSGIEYFPNIEKVYIENTPVRKLDLSSHKKLKELKINGSNVIYLMLDYDVILDVAELETNVDLGVIPKGGYDLRKIYGEDVPGISYILGAQYNGTTITRYEKEDSIIISPYTGNPDYPLQMKTVFKVANSDTDLYDLLPGSKLTKPYGEKAILDEIKSAIALVEAGTEFAADDTNIKSVSVETIPEPSEDGSPQDLNVTVVYKDDSTDTTTVRIEYNKAADKFDPKGKNLEVNVGENIEATDAIVNISELPTNTKYRWDGLDTTKPGKKNTNVIVTYPDQSTDEVEVTVTVVKTTTPTDPTEPDTTVNKVPVYRVYKFTKAGPAKHLLSNSKTECESLVKNNGWKWDNNGEPIFYGAKSGEKQLRLNKFDRIDGSYKHVFIAEKNISELDNAVKNGWNIEQGSEIYTNPDTSSGTPIYRFWNIKTTRHLYTTDLEEVETLKKDAKWQYDGIKLYSYK